MHQEFGGAELSARFIAPPTAIALTTPGSALPRQNSPLLSAEGCEVFNVDSCAGCVEPTAIDGGRITVTSAGRRVAVVWNAGYEDLLVAGELVRGGSPILIESAGASAVKPFSQELIAPPAFVGKDTLGRGLDQEFEVVWQPDGEDLDVTLLLNVVPDAGANIAVSCTAHDAAGHLGLPAEVFALLPPRPRHLQLQTSRVRHVDIPLGDGTAVTAHAGFTTLSSKNEE